MVRRHRRFAMRGRSTCCRCPRRFARRWGACVPTAPGSSALRQDTRYLRDGEVVDANDLQPNMRVFVRAGRTFYNELEAYQVIWGRILMPH